MNNRATEWVIRNDKERDCPDCIQKKRRTGASQWHCWAMVPYGYKPKLYYYSFGNGGGNITMQDYTKSILPIVEKRMKEVESSGETFIFQEDNDGGHGTRSSENIAIHKKIEMNLDFIEQWPANSPDLNPIENVWRILKSRVKLWKPTTKEALREAIDTEWAGITQDEIDNLIVGPKYNIQFRVAECLERNGYATRF